MFPAITLAYTPKEGNVNGTFGTYVYKTNFPDVGDNVRSPYLGGLALTVNGDSNDRGSLEISMFHMQKIYWREDHGNVLVAGVKTVQVNMGYRWWHNPYLSTSLTFFSSYPMGDPFDIYRKVTPGFYMDTSAQDLAEYGIDFAVQYQLYTYQENYAVVLDGRYSMSLTSKQNEKGDQYGLLLGVRFQLQERGTPPPSKKN